MNPMKRSEPCPDLERFERGRLDPARFTHREHVRMAYEMLRRYDFPESALRYANGLRRLCARIGRPEKFHQTVTLAFLCLIAERLAAGVPQDFAAFAAANADLFERGALERWYSPQRLASEVARGTFVLPDRR